MRLPRRKDREIISRHPDQIVSRGCRIVHVCLLALTVHVGITVVGKYRDVNKFQKGIYVVKGMKLVVK